MPPARRSPLRLSALNNTASWMIFGFGSWHDLVGNAFPTQTRHPALHWAWRSGFNDLRPGMAMALSGVWLLSRLDN